MKKKNIWRRVIRWGTCIASGLFAIIFLLFMIFIFNPFESDYHGSLINVLPNESQTVIYVPCCPKLREHLLGWISWENLRKARRYRKFIGSTQSMEWMRALAIDKIMAQRKQILTDYQVDILQWKNLSQLFGREAALALWPNPKGEGTRFLLLTRVSWKCKLIDGLLPYVLPDRIREKLNIDLDSNIHSAALSTEEKFYWCRYRDVQFFSNDKSFAQQALSIAQGKKGSITEFADLRDRLHTLSERGDIIFYQKNETGEEKKQGDGSGQIAKNFLPLQKVLSYTGNVLVKSGGKLTITFSGNFEQMIDSEENIYAQQMEWNISKILPKSTFACMTYPVPQQFWVNFKEMWPSELQKEANPYLVKLNQHYRKQDYFAGLFSKYLRDKVAIAFSNIDFVKENIQPFDHYPALAMICKTPQAGKFYGAILQSMETLREIVVKDNFKHGSKFTFFTKETYGKHSYIHIKYPDSSGGAVNPSIGFCGSYLVFTSHSAFLKEFFDVSDGFGNNLGQSMNFVKVRENLRQKHGSKLFLDMDNAISAVQKIENQCRLWYVRDSKQNRQKLMREFDFAMDILQQSQIFKLGCSMSCDIDYLGIHGKIVIPVEIRK